MGVAAATGGTIAMKRPTSEEEQIRVKVLQPFYYYVDNDTEVDVDVGETLTITKHVGRSWIADGMVRPLDDSDNGGI